jgi:septal ring factor EnvC (AmiA/AmiB activator)
VFLKGFLGFGMQPSAHRFLAILIALCGWGVLGPGFLNAQTASERQRLQKIRMEIERYRLLLSQQENKERNALEELEQIDREISLVTRYLTELRRQERVLRQRLSQNTDRLQQLQDDLARLKQIYARRLVHFYKYRNLDRLRLLLGARSLNEVLVLFKYSQMIARADRQRLERLRQMRAELSRVGEAYRTDLAELQSVIKEKSREESVLRQRKKRRQEVLREVKKNKKLLAAKIREYERAAREIERLIRQREASRLASPALLERPSEFPRLRGRLPWPARGKIVQRFGKVKHPRLNTYYINEGIDIQAPEGSAVIAPCSGVVTAITWQRGRGNIIIINHFGGYYTVYTHLSEILVGLGQEVKAGDIIGRVGDSGSIFGPVLHFEIWKEKEPVNPEHWLKKIS